jgi:DNA-binding response OmpR family regulator
MASRILIVDDERHVRETMQLALQAAGHEATTAADGPSGLDAFGQGDAWDLVLLDQRMPGMEGLEVLRRLLERDPAARIIMVTAFATLELAVDAMKAGAKDFLRKPFMPNVLRDTVAAALARPKDAPQRSAEEARRRTGSDDRAEPLITFRSLNGFEFWAAPASQDDAGAHGPVRHFTVRTPSHRTVVCTVEVSRTAEDLVKTKARREIPRDDHVWDALCQDALAEFLWERAEPPAAVLSVNALSPRQLETVRGMLAAETIEHFRA